MLYLELMQETPANSGGGVEQDVRQSTLAQNPKHVVVKASGRGIIGHRNERCPKYPEHMTC